MVGKLIDVDALARVTAQIEQIQTKITNATKRRNELQNLANIEGHRLHVWEHFVCALIQQGQIHTNDIPERADKLIVAFDSRKAALIQKQQKVDIFQEEINSLYKELTNVEQQLTSEESVTDVLPLTPTPPDPQ